MAICSPQSPISGWERRRSPRFKMQAVHGTIADPKFPLGSWNVDVENMSTKGTCIRTVRSFCVGSVLEMQLLPAIENPVKMHHVQVKWIKQLGDENWLIGGTFMQPVPDRYLELLLSNNSPMTNE